MMTNNARFTCLNRWRSTRVTKYQQGQALVETLIALLILAPMAVGVTLLGQYLHIQQQTRATAQEAAWSSTVAVRTRGSGLPTQATVEARLRAHQFGDLGAPLRSDAKAPKEFSDPMLSAFSGMALLKSENMKLTTYIDGEAKDFPGVMVPAGVVFDNQLPNAKGLITAQVSLQTEKITGRDGQPLTLLDPLNKTPLIFNAKTVLLTDAWDAAGAGETAAGDEIRGASIRTVRMQVQNITKLTKVLEIVKPIAAVGEVLGFVPVVGTLLFPGFDEFHPRRAAPDVVPADRLVKYKNVR